jgi:lipoteichoic acid synthase
MSRLLSTGFLVFWAAQTIDAATVSHTIAYEFCGAREAFIVWGVNNWNYPGGTLPAGSWKKDGVAYSPMKAVGPGQFQILLQAEEGTLIDYVFWITKGPFGKIAEIWDTNEVPYRDYHSRASANAGTFIRASVTPGAAWQVGPVEFAPQLTLLAAGFALLLFIATIKFSRLRLQKSGQVLIFCTGLSVLVIHMLVRPAVAGLSWTIFGDPLSNIPMWFACSKSDVVFVVVLTGIFSLLHYLTRRQLWLQRTSVALFLVISLVSLLLSISNERVVEMLGKPLSYQWIYYSGFLRSNDSVAAISANLTPSYVTGMCLIILSAVLLTVIFNISASMLRSVRPKLQLALASVAIVPGIVLTGMNDAVVPALPAAKTLNPVISIMASVNPFGAQPALFTMDVPDSMAFLRPSSVHASTNLSTGKIKNVLMIVLESTAAEYVDVFQKKFGATPTIGRLAQHAVCFNGVYAPAPATNLSMFSLFTGSYPWISYQSVTENYTDIAIQTLPSMLKSRGYRTAFFNSGDNGYQRAGRFLELHGFETVGDCNDGYCPDQKLRFENSGWEHMNGKRDACTASQLIGWIDKDRDRPFLAAMWTYQTHYPYFSKRNAQFVTGSDFNRYLNALSEIDSVIGDLCTQLDNRGLMDSTLVVLVGDHGEAFGQHGQVTHAREIYDENLRVPCVFYNPGFEFASLDVVAGTVDVAPAVLQVLGIKSPDSWHGVSLFARDAGSTAFFFAPWSEELFGFRKGNKKFIYNATENECEIYDLGKDPGELNNLANGNIPVQDCERLASWVQTVNGRFP